jgi:hypothetical protein
VGYNRKTRLAPFDRRVAVGEVLRQRLLDQLQDAGSLPVPHYFDFPPRDACPLRGTLPAPCRFRAIDPALAGVFDRTLL